MKCKRKYIKSYYSVVVTVIADGYYEEKKGKKK